MTNSTYITCPHCGEKVKKADAKHIGSLDYCPRCAGRFVVCKECGELTLPYRNSNLCSNCYSRLYFSCVDCGKVFKKEGEPHASEFRCLSCWIAYQQSHIHASAKRQANLQAYVSEKGYLSTIRRSMRMKSEKKLEGVLATVEKQLLDAGSNKQYLRGWRSALRWALNYPDW